MTDDGETRRDESVAQGKMLNALQATLKRPDLYLGSLQTEPTMTWLWTEGEGAERREIPFSRAITNIIREIVCNAIDNLWRSEKTDTPTTRIDITADTQTGIISVWNDGLPIPIRLTDFEYYEQLTEQTITKKMYPAEAYFGFMFSGTNYDDTAIRKTSGRNGLGSTLCNVLCEWMEVDHASAEDGKRFVQRYTQNASVRTKPKITPYTKGKSYTKITFLPDYPRFGAQGLWPDLEKSLAFYALEVAAIVGEVGASVKYNGQLMKLNLDKFAKAVFPKRKFLHITAPNKDECLVVCVDPLDPESVLADNVTQHSYVNGCNTYHGGIHVDKWRDTIVKRLVVVANERKSTKAKPIVKMTAKHLYPYLHFIVRADIDRPKFHTNTKDQLTSVNDQPYTLGEKDLSAAAEKTWKATLDENIAAMMKWPMIGEIDTVLQAYQQLKLDRVIGPSKSGRLKMNTIHYRDAPYASDKAMRHLAILVVVEGTSAKALVIAGANELKDVDERKRYGVLPLKGKLINACKHPRSKVLQNKEIEDLMEMLRLDISLDYSIDANFATLRYGQVRMLTDADEDGWHIRDLIMNFFWVYTPTLFHRRGFLLSQNTPNVIVQVKNPKATLDFYSLKDYKHWMTLEGNADRVTKKPLYLKGLGSIDKKEAPQYFENPKLVQYTGTTPRDAEAILMASSDEKRYATMRYDWLFTPVDTTVPHAQTIVEGSRSVAEFINEDLVHYFRSTFRRAVPCIWDGFKESTRKIFYAFRKQNVKSFTKVENCASVVTQHAGYHHGSVSITNAIVGMAYDFVGSNNIPLLEGYGQYGTRLEGGDDAAAGRYMTVRLGSWASVLFPPEDDAILGHVEEDGEEGEKVTYAPIIPMVLVNGANGIATGCRTDIPCCNPMTLIEFCEQWLDGRRGSDLPTIVPWYRGFTGEIEMTGNGWKSKGKLEPCTEKKYKGWWKITELPIGTWTEYYDKGPAFTALLDAGAIVSHINESAGDRVLIRFKPAKDFIPSMDHATNFKHLIHSESLSNLILIDEHNVPRHYKSLNEIAETFCQWRLPKYEERRRHQLKVLKDHIDLIRDRLTYIQAIIDGDLKLNSYASTEDLYMELESKYNLSQRSVGSSDEGKLSYDYLLSLPTGSMTQKRLDALKQELSKETETFKTLKRTSGETLWRHDLSVARDEWTKYMKGQ